MRKNIDKLCRICGKAEAQLIPIFSDDGLVHNLPVKIEKHLFSIQVTETDKLPQNMCYQCTSSLIIWNDLFELSIKTDRNLKNELEKYEEKSRPSVDFANRNVQVTKTQKRKSDPIGEKIDKDEIDESIATEIFKEIQDFDRFLNQSPTSSVASDYDNDPLDDPLDDPLGDPLDDPLDSNLSKRDSTLDTSSVQDFRPRVEIKKKNAIGIHAIDNVSIPPSKQNSRTSHSKKPVEVSMELIDVDNSDVQTSGASNSIIEEYTLKNAQQAEVIRAITSLSDMIDIIKTTNPELPEPSSLVHNPNEENNDSANNSAVLKKKRGPRHKDPSINNLERRVCHICGKFFKGADTMKIHLKTVHSTERPHVCGICNTAFKRKDHLDCHVKYKHGNNSYPKRPPKEGSTSSQKRLCVHCGKILSSSQILKEHINSFHSGNRPYNCEQCNLSFSRYSTFYHHTVVRNHKVATFFKTCDICGLDFQSEAFYFKHMWKHPENVFCEICNITFDNNDLFRNHIETSHEEEKSFQCSSCGKRFGSKNSLKLHLRVHSGEKPYECQYCSWKFHKKGQLVVHIYRHTGERPHVCDICGRGFKQKGDMRKHKAGHVMQLKKTGSSST